MPILHILEGACPEPSPLNYQTLVVTSAGSDDLNQGAQFLESGSWPMEQGWLPSPPPPGWGSSERPPLPRRCSWLRPERKGGIYSPVMGHSNCSHSPPPPCIQKYLKLFLLNSDTMTSKKYILHLHPHFWHIAPHILALSEVIRAMRPSFALIFGLLPSVPERALES